MTKYSRKVWLLERCGKKMYITTDNARTLKEFDDEQITDGQAITFSKCNDCCFNIFRVDAIQEESILTNHTVLLYNNDYYNDEHINEAFDIYPEYSLIGVYVNIDTHQGECDCNNNKFYYFADLCSENTYAVTTENFFNVPNSDVELVQNALYELWWYDDELRQSRRHFCRYIEEAENPQVITITIKNIRQEIPIEKFDCNGSFIFQKCGSEIKEHYLFVDGINVEQLQENSYYLVTDSDGLEHCYRYISRSVDDNTSENIIHIRSGAFKDCDCVKSSILFQTCDGEYTVECNEWVSSTNDFVVGEYYSVTTGAFQPVLNFDGYFYKNCLMYLGYSDDNPEIEPTYTGLRINKSRECTEDDCSIYFETTLSSCLKDYETTVYVSGELLNYMRANDYSSFMWNGRNCLSLPYGFRYVANRSDDIPTIELDDVDRFFKDCDECLETLDISCYVIHPCDGSRPIYIEKAQQGAMCEPVDLSIYENRYISFNYFGEIMCGYVEHNCKELTENDRRISSNNIIECYYSCPECYDRKKITSKKRSKK